MSDLHMPPEVLPVADDIELIRTQPLDGGLYHAMLMEDDAAEYLEPNAIQQAGEECFRMYNAMADGTMLSYWVDCQGAKVGHVGVVQVREQATQESYWAMEYWLVRTARAQGIMPRAARRVLDYAFGADQFSEVVLDITPENTASQSVARRIGGVLIPEESDAERQRWRVYKESANA